MAYYDKTYGELHLNSMNPERTKKGRFVNGRVPPNKGKRWSEYMDEAKIRRCLEASRANLEKAREVWRPETAVRKRKPVIMVLDDGKFFRFESATSVVSWSAGKMSIAAVSWTCLKNDGRSKNTDHKSHGVRLYYEENDIWMDKINEKYRI